MAKPRLQRSRVVPCSAVLAPAPVSATHSAVASTHGARKLSRLVRSISCLGVEVRAAPVTFSLPCAALVSLRLPFPEARAFSRAWPRLLIVPKRDRWPQFFEARELKHQPTLRRVRKPQGPR